MENAELLISIKNSDNGPEVRIMVDGKFIGMIQDIKFHAKASESIPKLEVTILSSNYLEGLEPDISVMEMKKFLPFISITEIDVDGNVVQRVGRDVDKEIKTKVEEVQSATVESTVDVMNLDLDTVPKIPSTTFTWTTLASGLRLTTLSKKHAGIRVEEAPSTDVSRLAGQGG